MQIVDEGVNSLTVEGFFYGGSLLRQSMIDEWIREKFFPHCPDDPLPAERKFLRVTIQEVDG